MLLGLSDQEDEMGGICSMIGESRSPYMILVEKPEGKGAFRRPRYR
jgi:hypothetical protein